MGLKLELLKTIQESKVPILTTALIEKHKGNLKNPRSRVWHELNTLEREQRVKKAERKYSGTKWVAQLPMKMGKAK